MFWAGPHGTMFEAEPPERWGGASWNVEAEPPGTSSSFQLVFLEATERFH